MAIRCSAKAIILKGDQILLNRCRWPNGEVYYDLPGGGQELYEGMEEAVLREVYEETGYRIRVIRLAAVAEEIYEGTELRALEPDYTHRISHIFRAELLDEAPVGVPENDYQQEAAVWMNLSDVPNLPMVPMSLIKGVGAALVAQETVWLGTEYVSTPEN